MNLNVCLALKIDSSSPRTQLDSSEGDSLLFERDCTVHCWVVFAFRRRSCLHGRKAALSEWQCWPTNLGSKGREGCKCENHPKALLGSSWTVKELWNVHYRKDHTTQSKSCHIPQPLTLLSAFFLAAYTGWLKMNSKGHLLHRGGDPQTARRSQHWNHWALLTHHGVPGMSAFIRMTNSQKMPKGSGHKSLCERSFCTGIMRESCKAIWWTTKSDTIISFNFLYVFFLAWQCKLYVKRYHSLLKWCLDERDKLLYHCICVCHTWRAPEKESLGKWSGRRATDRVFSLSLSTSTHIHV